MSQETVVLATLIGFNALLIAIGLWAERRNADVEDFYLGGRRLGPWVAALSASASSSSAWTLLGVSGAAFTWGAKALWLFPATVGGFLINWVWVAPRLRRLAADEGAITLAEVVAPASLGSLRRTILRAIAVIVVFSFVFYIASQFEAAGKAFEATFDLSKRASILTGAGVVLAYTLLGGFWAVSVTDCVQGLLMVVAAAVLPVLALAAVGGVPGLIDGLAAVERAAGPAEDPGGLAQLLFVLAAFGITIGYPGQPHVVNRYMASRDDAALARGRIIALAWAVLVYAGMLTVGLCARVLFGGLVDAEQVLFRSAQQLLPAVLAGLMLASVLSAVMSTVDSQLLTASSSLSHDWRADPARQEGLTSSRGAVIAILTLATALALAWRADIFSRVLFAWVAVGAALGPILVIRLTGRSLTGPGTLASVLAGFASTLVFAALPDTPGDFAERVLPFGIALAVALISVKKPPV
ncbi:MAG TPA: sodium/proline symporter [Woeseiaceae bacterium]|nr:sodium/proline symporter [Woeseiaceae bacterium]